MVRVLFIAAGVTAYLCAAVIDAATPVKPESEAIDAAATGSGRQRLVALQRRNVQAKPEESYYLTKKQLDGIDSVWCLQQKQDHPYLPCKKPVPENKDWSGDLSIGHFPHWRYNEKKCHSNYEFFCDPDDLLVHEQQYTVSKRLQRFKETTLVNCNLYSEKFDPAKRRRWYEKENPTFTGRIGLQDYREFNFAVVVIKDWPSSEMDPQSLTYFGRYLMTTWGLQSIYNGVDNGNSVNQVLHWDEYYSNCPNAAVLFIFPTTHGVYLHSPAAEFISHDRGGPEVEAAVLKGLETEGLEAGILAGIEEAQRVLKITIPASLDEAPVQKSWRKHVRASMMADDNTWIWGMRLYGIAMILFFAVVVVAFVYYNFVAPQKTGRMSALSANRKDCSEAIRSEWDM